MNRICPVRPGDAPHPRIERETPGRIAVRATPHRTVRRPILRPIVGPLAVLAVTVVLVAPPTEARAAEGIDVDDQARTQLQVEGTLTFSVPEGGTIRVNDSRAFYDTVELRPAAGVNLINDLSFDDYVAGIAEMPTRWPMEALKAQAVAARTYAWRAVLRGRYDGYDICATVACQVFRGANVELDSLTGHRWRRAVEATAGEVLLDGDGGPILARYFSTSGGRTYPNEEVFPSSGAFDYLTRIDDPYDEVSPYHRWTASFTRAEFDEILSRGATVSAVVPVADLARVGDVDDPLADIAVTGVDGRTVRVGAVAFRSFVSQVAENRFPDRYPQTTHDGERDLPATVPSSRFDVEVTDDQVILHGRGWGHGVGMGQYGAMGRAVDGDAYDDILAAYYNGLVPTRTDALPERVRVGVAAGGIERVGADTYLSIHTGGEPLAQDVFGTWDVAREGNTWVLTAPIGSRDDLDVSTTRADVGPDVLAEAVTVEVDVNKPVLLDLEIVTADGVQVLRRSLGLVEAGTHAFTWRFDGDDGARVPAGSYAVALVGEDDRADRAGTRVEVTVPEPRSVAPPVTTERDATPPAAATTGMPVAGVVAIGVLGLILLVGSLAIRRKP